MSYKVGLCDKDIGYTRGVMEYINKQIDVPIRVAAFSSEAALEEYLVDNSLDLIIVDENKSVKAKDVPIACFCEKKGKDKDIYKYQSGDKILEQILNILKIKDIQKQNTHFFYGVYSPVGRCGKTNFSLAICNFLKESIYINLEGYSGIDSNKLPYEPEMGDKFIYYLVSQNNNILDLLDSIMANEFGFKVVSGNTSMDVISQITKEDIRWFYRLLRDSGKYKCVVFDMGSSSLPDIDILDEFQKVYVPVLEDKTSKIKLKKFMNMFACGGKIKEHNLTHIKTPDVEFDNEKMFSCIKDLLM